MLHHSCQVVVRQAEGGEYNGEVGWEQVDRAFKLRSRNKWGLFSMPVVYDDVVCDILPSRSLF